MRDALVTGFLLAAVVGVVIIPTTETQDDALTVFLAQENGLRQQQKPPLPVWTRDDLAAALWERQVAPVLDRIAASARAARACEVWKSLTPEQQKPILESLKGNSPC